MRSSHYKKSLITCSRSLSTDTNMQESMKTRSSSVKHMATASEVGSNSGNGDALVVGWMSCSRKVSKSKVMGYKSLGSTPRFPPSISKKTGGNRLSQQQVTPSGSQHSLHSMTLQFPFICWAAQAQGTVVRLHLSLCRRSGLGCSH